MKQSRKNAEAGREAAHIDSARRLVYVRPFSMIRVLRSSSAVDRLRVAGEFISNFAPGTEILLVGASRDAVDDLVREIARSRIATFGLHRLSLMQLAARIAVPQLAESRRTPASSLGAEAVAARAAFEALNAGQLKYFAPVAELPGFVRAAAKRNLRQNRVRTAASDA